jgi:carboxymethylenebutenolidase
MRAARGREYDGGMKRIDLRTEDGSCRTFEFGERGRPGVLFYMDGVGIRPALFEMGERLAAAGYFVLLPDLFYRSGHYEPMDAKSIFSDPAQREVLRAKFSAHVTVANIMRDTRAFLDELPGAVGVTGYCMGGRMALAAAGTYPERVAAAAAYHPAGLATAAPDSPHLLAPHMKARIYVAAAAEDASFPEEQKARLAQALSEAGVAYQIETYPARHGFVPSDMPSHDADAAERHWRTLLELLGRALAPQSASAGSP